MIEEPWSVGPVVVVVLGLAVVVVPAMPPDGVVVVGTPVAEVVVVVVGTPGAEVVVVSVAAPAVGALTRAAIGSATASATSRPTGWRDP